jgi:hypothetical protein
MGLSSWKPVGRTDACPRVITHVYEEGPVLSTSKMVHCACIRRPPCRNDGAVRCLSERPCYCILTMYGMQEDWTSSSS